MIKIAILCCCIPPLIFFQSCVEKAENVDLYKESDYRKVLNGGVNAQPEGVELFENVKDTAYKLLVAYWDNGTVQIKSYFHNGLKNGRTKEFWTDGSLISDGMYKSGKKNGLFRRFHANNRMSALERYEDGKPIGEWSYFDTSGLLIKKISH